MLPNSLQEIHSLKESPHLGRNRQVASSTRHNKFKLRYKHFPKIIILNLMTTSSSVYKDLWPLKKTLQLPFGHTNFTTGDYLTNYVFPPKNMESDT